MLPMMYSGPPPVWPRAVRRQLSVVLKALMRCWCVSEEYRTSASSSRRILPSGLRARRHAMNIPFVRPQSHCCRRLPFNVPPIMPNTCKNRPLSGLIKPADSANRQASSSTLKRVGLRRASRTAPYSRRSSRGMHATKASRSEPSARPTSAAKRSCMGFPRAASASSPSRAAVKSFCDASINARASKRLAPS